MPTVPVDGRKQFPGLVVMLANTSLGRAPFAGVERVGPDAYVLPNSWPTPPPTPSTTSFSPLVAASAAPDVVPRSAGKALWPNLS
jgi:hypothetical protein